MSSGSSSVEPDRYSTVADGPEAEIKVSRSRFIGRVFHAADESEAHAALDRVRRRHHAARHHGFALRIGGPDSVRERADDAGEPAGTAGRPILARLVRAGIHDALLVVSRYFGGTKLGTGGLARAYGDAAQAALDVATVEIVRLSAGLVVECAFDDLGAVESLLARAGPDVLSIEREFGTGPRLRLRVRRSRARAIAAAIVEATAARAAVTVVG